MLLFLCLSVSLRLWFDRQRRLGRLARRCHIVCKRLGLSWALLLAIDEKPEPDKCLQSCNCVCRIFRQ